MNEPTRGNVPRIINNEDGLYEGNLRHYFRVLFFRAQNLTRPYHNFRHMFHVVYMVYQAIVYYRGKGIVFSSRRVRNVLIAALFHDFDHPGIMENDDLNIERAIRGLRKHILPEDEPYFEDIVTLIYATQYPHLPMELGPLGLIIRDADLSQAFSVAWIQQIAFGLSAERGATPLQILQGQSAFLDSLHFNTGWAQSIFPPEVIAAKKAEVRAILDILEEKPAS